MTDETLRVDGSVDLNAAIERELQTDIERELQADLNRRRIEIAMRLRREAVGREYDRINQRHAVEGPLAGLTPEQHAKRQRVMRENAAKTYAEMDEAERRGRERVARDDAAMRRVRASLTPGSEGFTNKG
jgi:hypothetical protein